MFPFTGHSNPSLWASPAPQGNCEPFVTDLASLWILSEILSDLQNLPQAIMSAPILATTNNMARTAGADNWQSTGEKST